MSTRPKTRPETWVPAGAETTGAHRATKAEPQAGVRTPHIPLPPPQVISRASRVGRVRASATNVLWAALAAGVPWLWFLVRDLGPVSQVVALALPALVAAAFVGLAISALDERKLSSIIVACSVAVFAWVTILGPRSASPASPPVDPTRLASITLDGSDPNVDATLGSLARQRADLAVVVEPTKKARIALLKADRHPYTLTSGRFVVMSSIPIHELSLPDGLPPALVIRFRVDRPAGGFIVYAVRSGASPLDAALNDPIGVEALRDAASKERLPVVLAGDLGIGDRSTQYRALTEVFRDAMRSGDRAASTSAVFPWSFLLLRTGFVLTSPDWCSGATSTFDVPDAQIVGLGAAVGPCRR